MKEKIEVRTQDQYNCLINLIERIVDFQYESGKTFEEKLDNYYDLRNDFDSLFQIEKSIQQKGVKFEP